MKTIQECLAARILVIDGAMAHAYFDAAGVRALLRAFEIDSLESVDASETAGSWAHTPEESARLRHWFVRARRVL